ncbi:MAG: ATP-dependent sacrificial sulfur transferase LarE [Planctomycetota bacterium]
MPENLLQRLEFWFDTCPHAAIAFSGGVDSAVVAFLARRLLGRERVCAWIADSPSLKRADLALARDFAAQHDIPLRILQTREMDNADYAANAIDRCYHCKTTLYSSLQQELARQQPDAWVLSGANTDDLGDYRPGMQAAKEARVHAPLIACGVDKDGVRALARHFDLACAGKPASPCLSSRVPYGQAVTPEKLARIEAAEGWLQARGFPVCRVRHDQTTARVEVPVAQVDAVQRLRPELEPALLAMGFVDVIIDAEGFVSGKLNREIATHG